MKTLKLNDITGSLADIVRKGLREPVFVTKRGKPVIALVPLTKYDDWESVSLSTNPRFLAIIERSAAAHKPGRASRPKRCGDGLGSASARPARRIRLCSPASSKRRAQSRAPRRLECGRSWRPRRRRSSIRTS